ncbi:hypothetical protein [Nostoc sp.]
MVKSEWNGGATAVEGFPSIKEPAAMRGSPDLSGLVSSGVAKLVLNILAD